METVLNRPGAEAAAAARESRSAAVIRESAALRPHREVLSFRLGPEEYGIDTLKVQEIRSFEAPTRIANAPPHIVGVLNLRGLIVPLVDMRLKFNIGAAPHDADTVTIVLNAADQVFGLVVDSVSDVVQLVGDQIRPSPAMGAGVDSCGIDGIGALGTGPSARMLILLDIERALANPHMGLAASHRSSEMG